MISPLHLGNSSFTNNIIQGPLAGISCAPFRHLVRKFGEPAFSCTEMISCKTLIYQDLKSQRRFTAIDPEEGSVCFQLAGNCPVDLAEAVKKVTDFGASLIDLNCGCPVKKIRNKGLGSSLLVDAPKLYQLIRAMKLSTHLPVSIKIRVENRDEKFNQDIANVVSDAGADFLIVHARHWTEHYETPCRHEEIQYFVQALKIPVIGNGDISCVDSLKKMLATGCVGVMIGRAGVGQPWLIKKLQAEMRGEIFSMPKPQDISMIFIEHVERLAELLGQEKFAILQARKFAKYYARSLMRRTEFCEAINKCETLASLKSICTTLFRE